MTHMRRPEEASVRVPGAGGSGRKGGRPCEKDLETKRPRKPARPAAEVTAYGVLEGGRAISGVSTCVSVAFLSTLRLRGSAVTAITDSCDHCPLLPCAAVTVNP